MRTTGTTSGVSNPLRCLLLLFCLALLAVGTVSADITAQWSFAFNDSYDSATYNISTQRQETVAPNTTPWELVWGSLILGVLLFLYSIRQVTTLQDFEASIVVAVVSWISIGYCCYASLSIDRIVGYGVASNVIPQTNITQHIYMENHLIYSEPVVTILMFVFFFVAVGYTIYRVARHPGFYGGDET